MTKFDIRDDVQLHAQVMLDSLRKHAPEDIYNWAESAIEKVVGIARDFEKDAAPIRASKDLTPEGQQHRMAELSETTRGKLDAVAVPALTQALEKAQQSINTEYKRPGDLVINELRDRELRDLLRQKDRLEVHTLYHQAAAKQDWDFMTAVEGAPKSLPLADTDTIAKGRAARALGLNPCAAERAEAAKQGLDAVNAVVQEVKKRLRGG